MKRLIVNKQKLFGTDGIRGTPGIYPLTDHMLGVIAQSLAHSVLFENVGRKRPSIVIGKDTRLSGENIEGILSDNISALGVDVLLVGTITTPGLSFFVKDLKSNAGIMISASHNKASDNGIKFFDAKGYKFSELEEEKVENIIFERMINKHMPQPKNKGKVSTVPNSQASYSEFLKSTVPGLDLTGITVALDCAWGAAAPFARKVFTDLGANVVSIHDKPSGHNINEGGAINPGILKKLVMDSKADIGVAVDGDGDRGILVNEKGEIMDGDYTIAIIARSFARENKLSKKTVVGTVMSNYGLRTSLEELGVKLIAANVGDKFVLDALLKNNLNLGGEQSGHIIFLDHLSTPDGLLTALQVLKVMKSTGKHLSELCKCMTKFPQILVNIKVKEKRPFEQMPVVNEKLELFTNRLKDEGRILLRYSGTEHLARVMIEGKDKDLIEEMANDLAKEIKEEIGIKE